MTIAIITYNEFSHYYDLYERLSEISQHQELDEQEIMDRENAGISLATLPIEIAESYLSRKRIQLKKSLHHSEEVLSRLTKFNDTP